jgi:hypothetical protein
LGHSFPTQFFIYKQYGKDYEYEAPVKILDKLLYAMPQSPDEQLVVISQVRFFCQSFVFAVSLEYLIMSDCLFDTFRCWWLTSTLDTKRLLTPRLMMIMFYISAFYIGLTTLIPVNTQVDDDSFLYFCFLKVVGFNGKPVKNLKSLAAMVESCDDEYLKFDLDYEQVCLYFPICLCVLKKNGFKSLLTNHSSMQIVVLRTKTAKAATLDILATHCIPSAMSEDLKS